MTYTVFDIINIGIALFGIGFLIGIHELGHFLFCKLFNVHTPSFAIGFGPVLWKRKIGDTEFSISALPLGGYVEIAGAYEPGQGEQTDATRIDEQSMTKKPLYQQLLIIFGGIFVNLLFTITVLTALFMNGISKTPLLYPLNATTIVERIAKDSPALDLLQQGDTIIAINDTTVKDKPQDLYTYIQNHPDETVSITIERKNEKKEIAAPIKGITLDGSTVGYLGIAITLKDLAPTSFSTATQQSITTIKIFTQQAAQALKQVFVKRSTKNLGGPVMIIALIKQSVQKGIATLLLFLAFISANLAILNLIPLPIFDGGQAVFYIIEAVRGKPLSDKVKLIIGAACWALVLLFFIYITFQDLLNLIGISVNDIYSSIVNIFT